MKKSKVKFIISKVLEDVYGKNGYTNTAAKLRSQIFNMLDKHTEIKINNNQQHKELYRFIKKENKRNRKIFVNALK